MQYYQVDNKVVLSIIMPREARDCLFRRHDPVVVEVDGESIHIVIPEGRFPSRNTKASIDLHVEKGALYPVNDAKARAVVACGWRKTTRW